MENLWKCESCGWHAWVKTSGLKKVDERPARPVPTLAFVYCYQASVRLWFPLGVGKSTNYRLTDINRTDITIIDKFIGRLRIYY
jgi:hypothetical protein